MNADEQATPPSELAQLVALPKHGRGVGLHRTEALLRRLPWPGWLTALDAIKITGSKGKGSVAALSEAILRALGLRVGLFTSPHLFRFEERVQIAGRPISGAALAAATTWVLDEIAGYEAEHPDDGFGAFEGFVGLALHCFAHAACDTAVIEAGIGGRYDPTRCVPGRIVALTSVESEHAALLGSTPELIAYDKCDLCPSGGTIVVGDLDDELLRRVASYCRVRSVEMVRASELLELSHLRYERGSMRFELRVRGHDFGEIESRLPGEHQARNIGLATIITERWLRHHDRTVDDEQLRRAVVEASSEVVWPGRIETIARDPMTIIDVGHTPGSARAMARTIRQMLPEARILLVTGVSRDKDVRGVLAELVPMADEIVCTRAHHGGSEVEVIATVCESLRPGSVLGCAPTLEEAVDRARERARSQGMIVVIAGGLFLSVEAQVHLRGGDPKALRFF